MDPPSPKCMGIRCLSKERPSWQYHQITYFISFLYWCSEKDVIINININTHVIYISFSKTVGTFIPVKAIKEIIAWINFMFESPLIPLYQFIFLRCVGNVAVVTDIDMDTTGRLICSYGDIIFILQNLFILKKKNSVIPL